MPQRSLGSYPLSSPPSEIRARPCGAAPPPRCATPTPTPEAVPCLLAALQDPSAYVVSSAAYALSNASANPGVVSGLLAALEDPSAYVRSSAAYAVARLA